MKVENGTVFLTNSSSITTTLEQTHMKIKNKLSALKDPTFYLQIAKTTKASNGQDNLRDNGQDNLRDNGQDNLRDNGQDSLRTKVDEIIELANKLQEKAILSAAQWACAKDFTTGCRVLRRHVQPKTHGNALVLIADFANNYEQIFHNPEFVYAKDSLEQVEANYSTIYRPLANISQMYDELDNEQEDRGINLLVIIGHGNYSGMFNKYGEPILTSTSPFPDRPSLRQIEANGSIVILSCYAGVRLAPMIKKHTLPSVKVYSSITATSNFVQDKQGFYFENLPQSSEGITRIDHNGVSYR